MVLFQLNPNDVIGLVMPAPFFSWSNESQENRAI